MVENEKFKFTIREGVTSTNKASSKKHTKRLAQLKRVTRFFFSQMNHLPALVGMLFTYRY
jgi:hypothetical protein